MIDLRQFSIDKGISYLKNYLMSVLQNNLEITETDNKLLAVNIRELKRLV